MLKFKGLNRVDWGEGRVRKAGGDCLGSPFHEVRGELVSAS